MRISDWSSDVCSSDLLAHLRLHRHQHVAAQLQGDQVEHARDLRARLQPAAHLLLLQRVHALPAQHRLDLDGHEHRHHDQQGADPDRRSEERGGGTECVSTWRSRWARNPENTNYITVSYYVSQRIQII